MRSGLERTYREFGSIVAQGAGRFKMVNLYGPDANRFVLQDRDAIFSTRKPWTQIMGDIFSNGLLLHDGPSHKQQRRIMFQAFRRPVLRGYTARMNPMIEEGLAAWPDRAEGFLAFDALKELTLDIAARLFVGVELGPEASKMKQAFEAMVAASMPGGIRLPLPGLEYNRGLKGRAYMLRFLGDMLARKRAEEGPDIFSRLCHARTEQGEVLTDQQILDHMVFVMMAAHDTTTSTLTSMVYELARHPDWQERIRGESRALRGAHVDFDEIDQLSALSCAMRETLRRYPPLPVIPRVATEPFGFGGFDFPAGVMVVISPIHTHYMDEWWTDPERFDPERFAPGRQEDARHTHMWIPFGGGPHFCLGKRFGEAQVRMLMHQLVLHYRWSVPEDYRMPVQEAPISKPRDGLPIALERLQ
jgi:cytochrome P450